MLDGLSRYLLVHVNVENCQQYNDMFKASQKPVYLKAGEENNPIQSSAAVLAAQFHHEDPCSYRLGGLFAWVSNADCCIRRTI